MHLKKLPLLFIAAVLLQFIIIYYLTKRSKKTTEISSNSLLFAINQLEVPVQQITSRTGLSSTFFKCGDYVIPIIVIACNRITVNRTLNQLFSYRELIDKEHEKFPIYVSRDCESDSVGDLLDSYKDKLTHLRHSNWPPPSLPKKDKGYAMIARHFKWALDQIFVERNYQLAIVVEDDLDISPDFFEYFAALAPLLLTDKTLYCISGWNDNGKAHLIDVSRPDLLYRSDFFPGLGWMLTQTLWNELAPKWPVAYWDEFMRLPEIRLGRACIRPEISRTHTFGRLGTSGGQFYDNHLKFNYLNQNPVKFDCPRLLVNLSAAVYDENFRERVYQNAIPVIMENMTLMTPEHEYRWEYQSKQDFLDAAKLFDLMQDFKYGVPRTAYLGIVPIFRKGIRIYLSPMRNWKQYNLSWT